MLSLAALTAVTLTVGTVRTLTLVARDGYRRVPTIARY